MASRGSSGPPASRGSSGSNRTAGAHIRTQKHKARIETRKQTTWGPIDVRLDVGESFARRSGALLGAPPELGPLAAEVRRRLAREAGVEAVGALELRPLADKPDSVRNLRVGFADRLPNTKKAHTTAKTIATLSGAFTSLKYFASE